MEGDLMITLTPPAASVADEYGQRIAAAGTGVTAWARRTDRGGREQVLGDVDAGQWETRYETRRDGLEALTEEWSLDDDGTAYDIQRVAEAPIGQRRWWWIFAVRRSAG